MEITKKQNKTHKSYVNIMRCGVDMGLLKHDRGGCSEGCGTVRM